MKKRFFAAALAALFLAFLLPAGAESGAFQISRDAVLGGMVRSWGQGYAPTVSGNTMTLVLPLLSSKAQGQVQGEIQLADETIPLFRAGAQRAARANKGENGLWVLRFSLDLLPDRQNGDYPCRVRLKGSDQNGKTLTQDIPLTLRIRDGRESREDLRLDILDLQGDFQLGEDGQFTALLRNPCKAAVMENIHLSFSDPAGDILPRYNSVLRLGDLAPGEQKEVSFPVTVLKKAAVAPHVITLHLNFTALGRETAQAETYTLPVAQEMRLEHGGLRMADTAVAGDSVSLSLTLMNLGKAEIINVICSLSLPGVTDRQAVLAGAIGPGESKQAQMTVSVPRDALGDYEGALQVTGEDNDGNAVSLSLPVHLAVEPRAEEALLSAPAAQKENEKPPLLLYGLGGGCAALLLLLIGQGAALRRKIHRLEEEKL